MNNERTVRRMERPAGDPRDKRVHPTQKPVAVIHWAIRQVMEGFNTVLDPWMGSGTTLFAAKLLNKSAIGIEIEEKYCEIAAERLSQEVLNFTGDSPEQSEHLGRDPERPSCGE